MRPASRAGRPPLGSACGKQHPQGLWALGRLERAGWTCTAHRQATGKTLYYEADSGACSGVNAIQCGCTSRPGDYPPPQIPQVQRSPRAKALKALPVGQLPACALPGGLVHRACALRTCAAHRHAAGNR